MTFVTAWLSQAGSSGAASLRLSALALVAMAGLPRAGASTVAMLLIASTASALTRIVGWRLFPDAAVVSSATPRAGAGTGLPDGASEPGLRYCLMYAATAAAALLLGSLEGLAHSMWVATTVLLVMQPQAGASYERIVQRVFGTFVGVLCATLVIGLLHSVQVLVACVLLIAFLTPHGISCNYWLHSALVTLLILVLYDLVSGGRSFDARLFSERVSDVLLGCLLALVGTVLAFAPMPAKWRA